MAERKYTMKSKKTVRKFYALHWKAGFEFDYDYDTIPNLDVCVATVLSFKKKRHRDEYVDRWHRAEPIPASIARKLIRNCGCKEMECDNI